MLPRKHGPAVGSPFAVRTPLVAVIAWLLPGVPLALAFAPSGWGRLTLLTAGLLINVTATTAMTTLLKLFGFVPLTRSHFLAGWGLFLLASATILLRRRRRFAEAIHRYWPQAEHWRLLVAAIGLCAIAGWIGHERLVIENFDGDGVEIFASADSLRTHLLPRWEIGYPETSLFGLPVAVPLWTYSYFLLPWILLLDCSEPAVRLPLLGTLALLVLAMAALARGNGARPLSIGWITLCLLSVLFAAEVAVYYGGYNLFVTDAAVSGMFLFLCALFLLQVHCAHHRQGWLLVALALLAIGTRYWAAVFTVGLLCAVWLEKPDLRSWSAGVLGWLGAAVGLIALCAVGIAARGGYLDPWRRDLAMSYGHTFRWPWVDRSDTRLFFHQWIILSGVVPFFGLWLSRRLGQPGGILRLGVLAFALFLAWLPTSRTFQGQPILALLTMSVWCCSVHLFHPAGQRPATLLSAAVLAGLAIASFPYGMAVHTASRQLGRQTCMLFSTYEEAMAHAQVAELLVENRLIGWNIDYPVWVHYADVTRQPRRPYRYYFSSQPTPPAPGAVLVAADPEREGFFFAANAEAAQTLREWTPPPRPRIRWLQDTG